MKKPKAKKVESWYSVAFNSAEPETTKVMLYDEIGGWGKTAGDFVAELNAIKTPRIDLHINSYGGEVIAGFACYNAIKEHGAEITARIDGIAASIASVIAMAADKVVIAKNAFLMIHNPWAMAIGDSSEIRKQADVLDKLCTGVAQAYADKTGKSLEEVHEKMNAETWFDSAESKEWGLADEIDGEADENRMAASALLAVAKYQKTPLKLKRFAAKLARTETFKGKDSKMEKVLAKDGKWFFGEDEVDVTDVLASATPAEAALAKAREDGVKTEREYRAMFNTVVAAAKLDAPGAVDFEKQFYGRNESDLKFLASHAIGQRAKPVGEVAPGNGEGETPSPEVKADKELVDTATKRFAAEPEVRRMFGLHSSCVAGDAQYDAALSRYVARERAWAKDNHSAAK